MEIQESTADSKTTVGNNSNFFYFDAYINGQLKSWKIQSLDVFKAYKKLVDDLGYDILYIYTTEGMNEEQKKIIFESSDQWKRRTNGGNLTSSTQRTWAL